MNYRRVSVIFTLWYIFNCETEINQARYRLYHIVEDWHLKSSYNLKIDYSPKNACLLRQVDLKLNETWPVLWSQHFNDRAKTLLEAFEYEITVQVYFKLFVHFFFSWIFIQINIGFVFEVFDFTVDVTIIYNLLGDLFVCFVKELLCDLRKLYNCNCF